MHIINNSFNFFSWLNKAYVLDYPCLSIIRAPSSTHNIPDNRKYLVRVLVSTPVLPVLTQGRRERLSQPMQHATCHMRQSGDSPVRGFAMIWY